jgi:hypothetical protein
VKTILLTTVTALAFTGTVWADGRMTKDEIDLLPQDSVVAIRKDCEREWGNDFRMRAYCEDNQYKALKALIDRGSVKGDSR